MSLPLVTAVVDGTLQRELDERYGEGVVNVASSLIPAT